MSRPDFKDIVHSQAQWEVIEHKLRERDEFQKAKSIIITRTEYKWHYDYSHRDSNPPVPHEEYQVLTQDQESAHIAYLYAKIQAKDKALEELTKINQDLEIYKPKPKTKRRFGFLWKIK